MNNENLNPEAVKLRALVREARVSPALPPRFQENVWQRIESVEASSAAGDKITWLDTLATWVLRPRFALAAAAVLIFAGVLLGARDGTQVARQNEQARYLAAVAPSVLR